MKILVADKFESSGVSRLKQLASDVRVDLEAKGPALAHVIAEYDPGVLIVRSNKVTRDALEAARNLKLIIRAGAGVDNIDVSAASARGISVANCPGQNAVAVAELTMGLILALDRRIPDNVAAFRAHKWNKKEFSDAGVGLKGLTLGVVGAGRIGTEVARRALAFDMKVLYYHLGRNRRLADFAEARRVELDDLLRESDVVTVHVPGGGGTKHLIDDRRVALMKPGALVINTARGSVVDEAALMKALREKKLRGAALDVFEGEPTTATADWNTPLSELPNIYATHHIGASTQQAQLAIAGETIRIVETYKDTGKVLNCVNLREAPASPLLVVRLVNKPGGLAHVIQQIAAAGINVEEMDHVIYDGGHAACAQIRIDRAPPADVMERIRTGHQNVLGVELTTAE